MSFENLRLFKDIAQTRSVSRGAAMNRISQSAASQRLQELEAELGIVLLDRSSRPLEITDAGRLYLDLCRDVLRRNEEFEAEIDRLKTEVEGTVRVASIYSVGLSEMDHLEREFSRRYPKAALDVQYLRPERVEQAVISGDAELGLMSYAEASREMAAIPWRLEEMVLAAAPGHPLASRSEVALEELNGLDFVSFDEDLPIRREVDRFLHERRIHVHVVLHFDNLQMMKEAVAHGAGVSILPARILTQEVQQGRLVPVPLSGKELYRPLFIVHRKKKRFARAAAAFLDLLREQPVESEAALALH
ncbi:MAG TPA: LysR family transcriptional regulator [Bryobacteraceae bacterium]|nr:LysR family transcriptional regulator [Bryobacteraceae bacterium]HVW09521.1 LysR family transcriptional regulator [Bryobacteraceae bacterium]